MRRLVLSVALLWSTPALAYPHLISEQEAESLTEATGAICNPDPTPKPCQLPYNPVWIRVSDAEYCMFATMCAAQSAGFDEATLELNTCEAENATLTLDLDACDADLLDCSGDVGDLTSGLDACTDDLATAEVTLTTQDGEITTLTVDLNDCQAELGDAQASLTAKDSQIATLEAEVGTLETENAAVETENAALETENTALETENASLEARIADLEDQIEEADTGECSCATPGSSGAPGAALLVALGLVRRRRAA